MKLSKIYSNQACFEPILFSNGLNVILGDIVGGVKKDNGEVLEHNLGKTSLVHLIDFLLLKKVEKGQIFSDDKVKLKDYIFFLEIKLNNDEYLTIKRSIILNTKISFKKHFSEHQNFVEEIDWDYKDLALNAKDVDQNPKEILNNKYLKFDVAKDFLYRKFLPYILRTQNDYSDAFLMEDKLTHSIRKPLMFEVLGFDNKILEDKYKFDAEINLNRKMINTISNTGESEKEIYRLKGAIEAKLTEKKEIQEKIDFFDFYKKEKDINFDLIKNIENRISNLNKEKYALDYNINQITKSIDTNNSPSLSIDEIKSLFEDVEVYFPENLSKKYDEVINFSLQITKEREKNLKDEFKEIKERSKVVEKELFKLNLQRKNYLAVLREKDTFLKYKKYQEDVAKIDAEIFSYEKKMDEFKTVEKYEEVIAEIKNKIKILKVKIKKEIDKENQNFKLIKELFQSIYKRTFEYTALLIVEPNTTGNVNFEAPVLDFSQDLSGKGKGCTSTRVLSVSLTLAILAHYSANSFYKFVYHDGIFGDWGNEHKIQFINIIKEYCEKYDLQYVISLINSEYPPDFEFNKEEIKRTLTKESLLFGIDF